jgi:hypothetical protein
MYTPSSVFLKENKSKVEFIKSLDKCSPLTQKMFSNFDAFPPFLILRDPSYTISYAKVFRKFFEARNEKKKIYNHIRMYEFATNLSRVNSLYSSDALAFSILYTIFDSLVGTPKGCSNVLTCNRCGITLPFHVVESLAQYQNGKIADILKPLNITQIEPWQELVKKVNRVRSETYHRAHFLNLMEEWLAEVRKSKSNKQITTDWDLNRVLKEFDTSSTAKKLAFDWFRDFVRALLVSDLIAT